MTAFVEIARRIQSALADAPGDILPIRMYVAGGAALHFYTGARVSRDIDAVFSHRIVLPEDLQVAYQDSDGAARILYFDTQYNDTLGLMHEEAREDSRALRLPGIDPAVLDMRLLSALDLAVSKLGRFSTQDRQDIETLARRGLIRAQTLRRRALEAASAYVGDLTRLNNSIEIACRIVSHEEPKEGPVRRPRPRRERP